MWSEDEQLASFWWILGLAGLAALILVLPNSVVLTKYVNDVLIFLDGAYRLNLGQAPNRDFHTALGPINFILPALAARITGTLGTAMSVGMALLILLLAPAIAHILSSRMRPVIGLPFAAFLILLLAVPMNLGESIFDLSFGMFYNRIGWVALAVLVAMYLRPSAPRRRQALLDGAAATLLTLVLLYTKASYGVVAVGFLIFMAVLDARQRRWAAGALVAVVASGLTIEAFWRGTANHAADLAAAAHVSGSKSMEEFIDFFLRNFADYILFVVITGLALWRTRRVQDLLFFAFCAGAGLLLISQNYQNWGIITLHAGVAVAAELLVRAMTPEDGLRRFSAPAAAPFLLVLVLLPTIAHCATALGIHAALATTRAGEEFTFPNYRGLRLAFVWQRLDHTSNARYLATLREGASILERMEPKPRGVFVLDFVAPFSSIAGLVPPRGDSAWQHWGRNVNEFAFIPPDEMFRDAEIVMEPKVAIEGVTGDNLRRIYGPYIDREFRLLTESPDWRVYRRTRASGA
jgi:hypothetical protein